VTWRSECKKAAQALPLETRQRFLDLMWAGNTIGQACEQCGIDQDAAVGIIDLNTYTTTSLRRIAN